MTPARQVAMDRLASLVKVPEVPQAYLDAKTLYVRVMLNRDSLPVNVTFVDGDDLVVGVIWQRAVSIEEGPFESIKSGPISSRDATLDAVLQILRRWDSNGVPVVNLA